MEIRDELTYKIIGCAMEVHKIMGNGFQEKVYQRCLAIELRENGILFERELAQGLNYKDNDVGTRRADFIIAGQIVVEIKAVVKLEDVHLAQAKNYLVAYGYDIGLLLNFGAKSLEYKRIFKSKKH